MAVADPGLFTAAPDGFSLGDVTVRLARPDERGRWDEQVDLHHYLGFKRFAGRGLRYVVEWNEQWLALAGWQSGAFKSRHRDRWVGWSEELRYRRLHLIANNTRFVILSPPGVFPHLGSWALARMTQRLSADWEAQYGHPLLAAESFVDPGRFAGTCYRAANWQFLGRTRGYARHNGRYTQPHGRPKQLYVHPLRRDARERLRDPGPLPAAWEPKGPTAHAPARLRSLYDELAAVPDFRRAQGRKHTVASVLAVYILARLANCRGPVAAAEYARQLSQSELKAVGAWKSPRTGRYVPVSKSTLHRVIGSVDPRTGRGGAAALRDAPAGPRPSDRHRRQTHPRRQPPRRHPGTKRRPWSRTTPGCRSRPSASTRRAARPRPCAPCSNRCPSRGACSPSTRCTPRARPPASSSASTPPTT